MSNTPISPEVIAAYERTEYLFLKKNGTSARLRCGVPSTAARELIGAFHEQGAFFITAFNPYSVRQHNMLNQDANYRLRRNIDEMGAGCLMAQAIDPSSVWPVESGFFVIGPTLDEACILGTKFKQNAIVWVASDGVPRLVLLR
jgi:hypothetical protein